MQSAITIAGLFTDGENPTTTVHSLGHVHDTSQLRSKLHKLPRAPMFTDGVLHHDEDAKAN